MVLIGKQRVSAGVVSSKAGCLTRQILQLFEAAALLFEEDGFACHGSGPDPCGAWGRQWHCLGLGK